MPEDEAPSIEYGLKIELAEKLLCRHLGCTLHRCDLGNVGCLTGGYRSMKMGNALLAASKDIAAGLSRRDLWLLLGWNDVRLRFKRSWLGPFWVPAQTMIVALILGSLYAIILKQPSQQYIPYLTTGLIAWTLLASLITEGATAFTSNGAAIREINLPLSVYAYRTTWKNFAILGLNFFVYVAVAALFEVHLTASTFLIIPAIFLVAVCGICLSIILGSLCAQFRDLSPAIGSIMRLLMFVTPVLWVPHMAGRRSELVHLNPLYHLLEILRSPLLGVSPPAISWLVAASITVVGCPLALLVLARTRTKIVYWV